MEETKSFTAVVLSWRRLLLRATIAGAVVSAIVSLLLPRWYEASSTLTPPQDQDTGLGLMSVVSQLTSSGGAGRARGLLKRTGDVDTMIGVLKSRRIRGEVVDRFNLIKEYRSKSREHAINVLGQHLRADTTPEGFIDVRVEARSPKLAADLTNAFVEALDRYNRATSVGDAKRTKDFIASCLDENQQRMATATEALRKFQEEHGAVQLEEQGKVTVEAIADLEAEKTRLQIQKGVLENYALPDQPQIQQIEAQIREIDKRMDRLNGAGSAGNVGAGEASRKPTSAGPGKGTEMLLRLHDLPRLAIQYAELEREVMAQEKVYEFLTAQFEEARIRESRDLQTVAVLDEAVPPIKRARPRRTLIVVLSTGLAFVMALGTAFAAETAVALAASNAQAREAQELRWLLRATEKLRRWGGAASAGS
ncbi:MAG: GNVR domain-containing protein [bacterium]